MSRDRGKATDEQREAEMRFSETLRQKARDGRPRLEDLQGRARDEDEETNQERMPNAAGGDTGKGLRGDGPRHRPPHYLKKR